MVTMPRTYDLSPSDEALYQRSNEYLSRLNALDPYSREYRDVYNDYLDTIDQISNRDFKASLGSTVAKFTPLVRPQVQRAQVQPQTPSRTTELNKTQNIPTNLESFYINTPYGLSLHTPHGMEGVTLTNYPPRADTPEFLLEDMAKYLTPNSSNQTQAKQDSLVPNKQNEGQIFYNTLLDKLSPRDNSVSKNPIDLSYVDLFNMGNGAYPYHGFSPSNSLNALQQQQQQQQQKEAVTPPSLGPDAPEEQAAQLNLYKQYLSKAADYNNVRLSDLNADARAITSSIRKDLSDIRNYLAGQTDNSFKSAFENPIPEALMAAFSYLRDVDANGQYRAGSTSTAGSGETAKWESLITSPREEQLKAYFDSYGGTRGFGVDEGEDSAELSIIRNDYEDFTQRLLPRLRKAFNISNDAQARNIAGYMALQLLHKGTERNSAFNGYLQDPYDYQHQAAEDAYKALIVALENPDVLHTLDMVAKANTVLNQFETANQAYNNAVTARNNHEAALTSLYGNRRSILQEAVGNDMIKNIGTSIRARGGLIDSLESFNKLQKSQE